ncbi:nucleotidyltransferase domain-containing protein [Exiguobacterium sp. s57]|uniref:SMODS domain-containing nucleotidyltransferase n=1 Tax=Exiguobacterium sp. s57 TaxID=2751258 RepID=UPI001BE72A13|nr:nucleotidyltransferase domain-containing protein [Exiguobacterium sp. s57]
MGVGENFNSFCFNLNMSSLTVETIQYRYKRIVKQINQSYWNSTSETAHGLYVGSYGRGTEIWTSDIDIIVSLPHAIKQRYDAYVGNRQSAFIQNVKNEIAKTYPRSKIRGDGQVIVIEFDDGIRFEIVPAFLASDLSSYIYPDTNNGGSWRVTDPRSEMKAMNELNALKNKNLKRLCRMARAWKSECNVPINGILIDTLAYRFLNSVDTYDSTSYYYYDWMSRDFFKYLMELSSTQEYWYAPGSVRKVYKTGDFQHKAKRAYNKALEAIDDEEYPTLSKLAWREIYGSKFAN